MGKLILLAVLTLTTITWAAAHANLDTSCNEGTCLVGP
jgi:hypothetical protein